VKDVKLVSKAEEEVTLLKSFDPKSTAIVNTSFEKELGGYHSGSGEGEIKLTDYQPNYLKYSAQAATDQLTVFSDIYYENGWKAYVDGKEVPHFRVNYILRALVLPAGEHTVEFKFHPASYYTGNKVSLASSLLLLLAIAGYAYSEFRKRKNQLN